MALEWLEGWFKRQRGAGHNETINTMAPYLTLLHLYLARLGYVCGEGRYQQEACASLFCIFLTLPTGLQPECGHALTEGAKRAFSHIWGNGIVTGVSYGTIVSDDLAYYGKVPLIPTGYG